MDGRDFARFHVDVGIGDEVLDPVEVVTGKDWLGFGGVKPPSFPMREGAEPLARTGRVEEEIFEVDQRQLWVHAINPTLHVPATLAGRVSKSLSQEYGRRHSSRKNLPSGDTRTLPIVCFSRMRFSRISRGSGCCATAAGPSALASPT